MAQSLVEVSASALTHNFNLFRELAPRAVVAPVVKANAYGHGLLAATTILDRAGATWLCVNDLEEAMAIRRAGLKQSLLLLGYLPPEQWQEALRIEGLRVVIYSESAVRGLSALASRCGITVPLHIKVETGNNRQGLPPAQAVALARLVASLPGVALEGLSSHYADIEDTTDHTFARGQLARFNDVVAQLATSGIPVPMATFSNSAATLLWPESHFSLVRTGISLYGMWPSKETRVSAEMVGRHHLDLRPALTWKSRIAQVKELATGEDVGYGRTWRTTRPTRLAVVPVGYYDGYDRGLSNLGQVLVQGVMAPVRGRVCMNMTMIDITDIPHARADDEVVLLGRQGEQSISAERMGDWLHTINYEVVSRINDRIPRVVVE